MEELHNITFKTPGMIAQIEFKGLNNRLRAAQAYLTAQIAADCTPYVPFRQGTLRQSVWYPDTIYGGTIEWNTPYAHRMYEGPFHYWTPGTGDHWFDKARENHGDEWIAGVKKIAGGGTT